MPRAILDRPCGPYSSNIRTGNRAAAPRRPVVHDAVQLTVAGKRESSTLAEWLYTRLYRLRNDYLHGNPVEPAGFDMDNGTSVLSYPAALYRMALASKVPVEDPVTHDDVKSGRRSLDDYSRFHRSTLFQSSCEDCLLRAVDPEAMKEEE